MINKLIWTSTTDNQSDVPQFEFTEPYGFKVYSNKTYVLKPSDVTYIDLEIKLYSKDSITLFFDTPKFSIEPEFILVNKYFVITANSSFLMKFLVLNCKKTEVIILKNQFISNFIIMNTNFINLFEVNPQEFKQYE